VPAENATGIAPGTNVTAFFSEAMKAGTVTNNVKLYKEGTTTALRATVTYDVTAKKATLNPSANLQPGAKYKAVVSTGATDMAGNPLDQSPTTAGNQPKSWTFTVRNEPAGTKPSGGAGVLRGSGPARRPDLGHP
jgi:Big-like domain-containing protein